MRYAAVAPDVTLTAARPVGGALRRGANWAFWAWFAVVALVAVLLAGAWVIGWRVDIVRSASMAPTVPEGSVAIIAPVAPRAVTEGDVIRFRQGDEGGTRRVLHRVVGVERLDTGRLAFTTQGDANVTPDPRVVLDSQVEGRLVFHVPRLGSVMQTLRSPAGLVVLVGLPLAAGVVAVAAGRKRSPQ